jgi:hypothetical protein
VALSQPDVLWGLLKGGTSIIWHCLFGGCCEYWFFSSGLGQGKWRTGWVVSGTLLGPEGSGVFCSAFQCGPCLLVVPLSRCGVVGAGVGWGSARILRTTQWTRASL